MSVTSTTTTSGTVGDDATPFPYVALVRIRAVNKGILVPPNKPSVGWRYVPSVLVMEELYLGFLPASTVPLIFVLLFAVPLGVTLARSLQKHIDGVVVELRRAELGASKTE